jgi:acetylornithine deacetylase
MEALAGVLARLERLVAFDTRNPPRAIDRGGIFAFLAGALPAGFSCHFTDLGEGCVSLLAVRGAPSLLFNVHLDTVPADPAWTGDPLALRVERDRAIGLGACDIKGAAACLVEAVSRTSGDAALLFTSDEEAGSSRCVRAFVSERRGFDRVVVAEPTRCRAVLEHRGIATCSGSFLGTGGHASAPRALEDSALHEAVRWAARALAFAEGEEQKSYKGLTGVRFNLGTLSGGTKANMIAAAAELRYGVRPRPDQRPHDLLATIDALAPHPDRVRWTPGFVAPPLPTWGRERPHTPGSCGALSAPGPLARAEALAADLGLPEGEPVDFWTEGALFSEAGLDTIVYGPGDIAQAHTAGEWVRLEDLAAALAAYERILSDG